MQLCNSWMTDVNVDNCVTAINCLHWAWTAEHCLHILMNIVERNGVTPQFSTQCDLTIMHGVCLFVPYTNCRPCDVRRETCHARWGTPGGVLRGPACDYLPCGKRTCGIFLGRGTGETPFLIDVMRSPVAGRNALKRSKTYRWGKPAGRAPRGLACDYIPVLWPRR